MFRRTAGALTLLMSMTMPLAACSSSPSPSRSSSGSPAASASAKSEQIDVSYVPGGSDSQRLDLFLPSVGTDGSPFRPSTPSPLAIFIHGGKWAEGDKAALSLDNELALPELKARLLDAGWAVASLNYRLSGEAQFPAPLYDVKAATRYLRANAASEGIDPDRFVVMGESSGGHLAQLLGTTNGEQDLEGTEGTTDASSDVQGVVSYYGISDLRTRAAQRRMPGCPAEDRPVTSEGRMLGVEPNTSEGEQIATVASPIAHLDASDPPMLLFHGRQDCNVRTVQSETMHAALQKAGVRTELTLIDAAHAQPVFYTREDLQQQLLSFLSSI